MVSSSSQGSDALNPDHNNYASIIGFDIASFSVCAILCGLRFYVRIKERKLKWDDWFLLAGVICCGPSCMFDVASWVVLERQGVVDGAIMSGYYENIGVFFYVAEDILIRAVYLIFYLRIMPPELGYRWHRRIVITVYTLYALYLGGYAFMNLFRCGLPSNLLDPNAVCINTTTQGILFDITYGCDMISDWTLAIIAMDVVRRTIRKRKLRFSLITILAIGCVAGFIAVFIPPFANVSALGTSSSANLSRPIIIDILATCEATLSIICLCLTALRPLFSRWLDPLIAREPQEQEPKTLPTLNTYRTQSDMADGEGKDPSDKNGPIVHVQMVVESREPSVAV